MKSNLKILVIINLLASSLISVSLILQGIYVSALWVLTTSIYNLCIYKYLKRNQK